MPPLNPMEPENGVPATGILTLLTRAPDEESLARVQHVLGSHLERFGQRNELTVARTIGT